VVGEVRRLLALPSCEALEVARGDGDDLLVPLVRDAVRSVDVQAGVVDVDLDFLGERESSTSPRPRR
jgi:16S rRNA processing protein RimM